MNLQNFARKGFADGRAPETLAQSDIMTASPLRMQRQRRLRNVDQVELFRFNLVLEKAERLLRDLAEAAQLFFGRLHQHEDLLRHIGLDLCQEDDIAEGFEGLLTSCITAPAKRFGLQAARF